MSSLSSLLQELQASPDILSMGFDTKEALAMAVLIFIGPRNVLGVGVRATVLHQVRD